MEIRLTVRTPDGRRAPNVAVRSVEVAGRVLSPIEHVHAWRVSDLPPIHRDPFDRLLIAQAQIEGLTLLTMDREIARYEVETRW